MLLRCSDIVLQCDCAALILCCSAIVTACKFMDLHAAYVTPTLILSGYGGLVVKCSVCCTGDMGSIPGPDTCDRQSLGMSCTGGVTL